MQLKKNKKESYISSIQSRLDLILKFKEFFLVLASLVFWGLNIWLAYKLAPFKQDLSDIISRVSATESSLDKHEEHHKVLEERVLKIDQNVSHIRGVLDAREQ